MSYLNYIKAAYNKALSNGNLIFFDSVFSNISDRGVKFEVRVAHVLAKMADTSPEDKKKDKAFVNPFLNPEKELIVKEVNQGYTLILNKFCIVPYHLLLIAKTFIEQGTPLGLVDFDAILRVIGNMHEPSVVFYNSGTNSGASQPHKHIQIVPFTTGLQESPVIELWLRSDPDINQVFSSKEISFTHWGIKLDPDVMVKSKSSNRDDLDTVSVYLKTQYEQLLLQLFKFWQSCVLEVPSIFSFDPKETISMSYNFILTKSAMVLIPRSVRDTMGIPINSLAFAGLLLCKSDEQVDLIAEMSPLKILGLSGFSSLPSLSSHI